MIQGGGYIAVEFARIFAGLGSHVTLIYRGENILRDSMTMSATTSARKWRRTAFAFSRAAKSPPSRMPADVSSSAIQQQSIPADRVILAIKRANVANQHERHSVDHKNSGVAVNEKYRVTVPNVYTVARRDEPD